MAGAKKRIVFFVAFALIAGLVAVVVRPSNSRTAVNATAGGAPRGHRGATAATSTASEVLKSGSDPTTSVATTSTSTARGAHTTTSIRDSVAEPLQPSSPAPSAEQPTPVPAARHNGQIVFSGVAANITLINPDGSGRRELNVSGASPSWSADGTKFIFEGNSQSQGPGTYIGYPSGGATKIASGTRYDPVLSPDGTRYVFVGGQQVHDDGSSTFCLGVAGVRAGSDARCIAFQDGLRRPSWSPDGARIYFGGIATGPDGNPHENIYSVDSQTGADQRLVLADAEDADFAPDGRIAFERESSFGYEVWTANADGSNQRNITRQREQDEYPSWSPDGSQLLVICYDRAATSSQFTVVVMTADGEVQTRIPDGSSADW